MPYDSIMYGFKKIGEVFADNNWCDSNAVRYFQLKYNLNANTAYYGWLKLRYANYLPFTYNIVNDTIYIESYGMNSKPNEVIRMGQTAPNSIIDKEQNNNYSIYPNPSTGIQTINLENIKFTTIDLYSIEGKKIKTIFNGTPKAKEISIDLTDLPNGIYYYLLFTENNKSTSKIIKK